MTQMLISLMIVVNAYIAASSDVDTAPPERTPENTASAEEQRQFTIEELQNGMNATESEILDFLLAVTNDNKPLIFDYEEDDDGYDNEIYTTRRARRMTHENEEETEECRDRIEFTIKFKEETKGKGKGKPSKHYQQCVENFGGSYFVVEPDCDNEDNLFKIFSRDDGQSSFSVFGRNHLKNPKQHHHHHHKHGHNQYNHDNIDDEYYWMLLDTSDDDHNDKHENMLYYGDQGYALNDSLTLNSIKPDFDCSTDYAALFNTNHHFKDCQIESLIGCYVECPTCFHDSITTTGAHYQYTDPRSQLRIPPSTFDNWNGEYKRAIYNPGTTQSFYGYNSWVGKTFRSETFMFTKWNQDLSVGNTLAILFPRNNYRYGYPVIAGTDGTLKFFSTWRWSTYSRRWYASWNRFNTRSYGMPSCGSIDQFFNRYSGSSAIWYDMYQRTFTHIFDKVTFNDCPNVDFQCS